MPFELDNQCPDGKHNFSPIIEDGETVGLKCSACPKEVHEDMERSRIVLTGEGIAIELKFHEGGYVSRKDPRF
jgi:hypothetical protein